MRTLTGQKRRAIHSASSMCSSPFSTGECQDHICMEQHVCCITAFLEGSPPLWSGHICGKAQRTKINLSKGHVLLQSFEI